MFIYFGDGNKIPPPEQQCAEFSYFFILSCQFSAVAMPPAVAVSVLPAQLIIILYKYFCEFTPLAII